MAFYDTLRKILRSSSNSERPCNKVLWYVSPLLFNVEALPIFYVSFTATQRGSRGCTTSSHFPSIKNTQNYNTLRAPVVHFGYFRDYLLLPFEPSLSVMH